VSFDSGDADMEIVDEEEDGTGPIHLMKHLIQQPIHLIQHLFKHLFKH